MSCFCCLAFNCTRCATQRPVQEARMPGPKESVQAFLYFTAHSVASYLFLYRRLHLNERGRKASRLAIAVEIFVQGGKFYIWNPVHGLLDDFGHVKETDPVAKKCIHCNF